MASEEEIPTPLMPREKELSKLPREAVCLALSSPFAAGFMRKESLFPQFLLDPEGCSGHASVPRPSAQKTVKLTGNLVVGTYMKSQILLCY